MVSNGLIKGVVIGGLIGAGVGILYAPKSGKETRDQIRNSAEDVLEKAKGQYGELTHKFETMKMHNREIFADKKDRLKKALDAGLEAYHQANVKQQCECRTGLYGDDAQLDPDANR